MHTPSLQQYCICTDLRLLHPTDSPPWTAIQNSRHSLPHTLIPQAYEEIGHNALTLGKLTPLSLKYGSIS